MEKNIYQIRPATVQDIDALVSIEQESYEHPWTPNQLRDEFVNPVSSVSVCVAGERILGYLCCWLIAGELQILKLTTCPSTRRQGVARQLLNTLSEQPLDSIWLEVRESNNAAIGLYRSFGFFIEGRRKRYYPDGEDALLMVRN